MKNTFCSINYINGAGGMELSLLISMYYNSHARSVKPGPSGNAHAQVGPFKWNWDHERTQRWTRWPEDLSPPDPGLWERDIVPLDEQKPVIAPTHREFDFVDFFNRHENGTCVVITMADAYADLEAEAMFLEKFETVSAVEYLKRTREMVSSGKFKYANRRVEYNPDFWRTDGAKNIPDKYQHRVLNMPFNTLTRHPRRTVEMLSEFLKKPVPIYALEHHTLWCNKHRSIVERLGLEW